MKEVAMGLTRTLTSYAAALAALASATALTAPSAMAQDAAKPNILFVMADDVAWMAPGIYQSYGGNWVTV